MTSNNKTILIVTGCNSNFFPNLRILIGSWMEHMQDFQLAVCDFGLLKIQIDELNLIEGLRILTSDRKVEEPLAGKTMLRSFIGNQLNKLDAIMWIDSDAFFNTRLPEILPILDGYDMLIDSHIQSIGEISDSKNISDFSLRRDDSYFSAGWWVGRPGNFLKRYEEIGQNTRDRHFWEGDAFVSAIYLEKLKIRSINGSIWHSRGKTSLSTCNVIGFTAFHVNQPIYHQPNNH